MSSLHIFNRLKITVQFARLGRLFLCLIIILTECVSGTKEVMPKLTTTMKSTIIVAYIYSKKQRSFFGYRKLLCNVL